MLAAMQETEAPPGTTLDDRFSREELQLAARNHGMPLEALRHDITPVGLHYLLIHYDIPFVDENDWQLSIEGHLERPVTFDMPALKKRPTITVPVTMECAGNGRARLSPRALSQPWLFEAVGTGAWTGTPLAPLLEEAGIRDGAIEVLFGGIDRGLEGGIEQHYERSLPLSEVLSGHAMLAWALNGAPLPPQHGYPLRLVVPGWYGMTSVKWLTRIAVLDAAFTGYQQARAYRFRSRPEDEGDVVTRIAVRSLMVPPGIPDFFSRGRFVEPGPCLLEGRAWSGHAPIAHVDISTDGGANWQRAALEAAPGRHAWQRFSLLWEAEAGEHQLWCRAADEAGNRQPLEPVWNLGGYAVNAIQRVAVTVRASSL
jgi:DMSO/TMAO reductase YedYZ molybdopterin-dependent catalytic subunit